MVSWAKYFRDKADLLKKLEQVESERDYQKSLCDDLSESNMALNQTVSELQEKINTMKSYKDSAFLDNLSLVTAKHIDDIFVRSWQGAGQRTANVQCLLRNLLNRGLTGSANGK